MPVNPFLQSTPPSLSLQPQPIIPSEDIVAEVARAHAGLSPQAKEAVDKAHGILQAQPQPVPQQQPGPTPLPRSGSMLSLPRAQPPVADDQPVQIPAPGGLPKPIGNGAGSIAPLRPTLAPAPPTANEAELQRMRSTGSGISQIHNPLLRGLATAADAIGTGLFPRIAAVIPGTTAHHAMDVANAEGAVGDERARATENESAQTAQATREHLGAQTGLAEAQSDEARALAAKAGQNPTVTKEWQEITGGAIDPEHPELGTQPAFYNKNNPKEGIAFGNAKAGVKPQAIKEGEEPLGDERVAQLNELSKARYQVLHPGGDLPPHYTIPANATQKDYDRIDKAMESTEKALGTKAQQDQLIEMRKQTAAIAQKKEAREETKADPAVEREYMAVRGGINKQFESAQGQIDKIQQAKAEINSGAVGQALGTIKTLAALAGGQGSGVRITQSELDSLTHARGIKGDFNGWLSGLEGKGKLDPTQIKQINDVLSDIEKKAGEKQKVYGDTLDKLGGAKSTKEIRDIESEYRKNFTAPSASRDHGGSAEPTLEEINAEVERRRKAKGK